MRVGIIAGEASGDILGAGLIQALKKHYPHAIFEGIAGPKMIAAGCRTLFPMEILSVTGIVEVASRLWKILSVRKSILNHFFKNPPDIFIGIDAPDFNLPIELQLHQKGIKTVHYTSPTVWAWRQNRIHTIAKSVDLMLTLFPFEADFYEQHRVPVRFVGHPLADMQPIDKHQARKFLHLPLDKRIVALLPGSRSNELKHLSEPFLKAAAYCLRYNPELEFVVPFADKLCEEQFLSIKNKIVPELALHYVNGYSREVIAAADVVLVASGTAALECLLQRRPMVVAYRLSWLTYLIAKQLVKVPYVSLPNLLAGKLLVPEFIQDAATSENLGAAILAQLANQENKPLMSIFEKIHQALHNNASEQAASAIIELIG